MTELRCSLQGLWLSLITPFRHGALDQPSLRRMVRHYVSHDIDGLIVAGTTGESLTLEAGEIETLVFTVRKKPGG